CELGEGACRAVRRLMKLPLVQACIGRTEISPKLAIFAPAPVDRRVNDRLVPFGLAGDTGADARKRLAATCRNRFAAIVAFVRALAVRSQSAGAKDGIFHRVLGLVLNRSIASPTACHCRILPAI